MNPPPDLKDPAPHVFYAIVVWGVFLPIWTIVTVIFDLVVAVRMAEEFDGECAFLLLFSLFFNATMLMLWWGAAIRLMLPRQARLFHGTGIRELEYGDRVCFRLPRVTPLGAAYLTLFIASVILVLMMAMATGGRPPLALALAALGLTLASAVIAAAAVAKRIAEGKSDLVIDRLQRTITLPQTFGRNEPVTISRHDVDDVCPLVEKQEDSDGVAWSYPVIVKWRSGSEQRQARLAELSCREAAQVLANSIREQVLTA